MSEEKKTEPPAEPNLGDDAAPRASEEPEPDPVEADEKEEEPAEGDVEGDAAGNRKKRGAVTDAGQLRKIVADTNEVLMKLQTKRGVLGVLVANNSGAPVRDTFPQAKRQFVYNLAGYMHQFRHKCNYVLKILYGEKNADVHVFRIRSVKYEIICIPDPDYYLVVVQDPTLINLSV